MCFLRLGRSWLLMTIEASACFQQHTHNLDAQGSYFSMPTPQHMTVIPCTRNHFFSAFIQPPVETHSSQMKKGAGNSQTPRETLIFPKQIT